MPYVDELHKKLAKLCMITTYAIYSLISYPISEGRNASNLSLSFIGRKMRPLVGSSDKRTGLMSTGGN